MHSSILLLLAATSLGLAIDCTSAVEGCISSVNVDVCSSSILNDPCNCSKDARIVQCWSSLCPDQTQADSAAAFYSSICLGSLPGDSSAMPTSVSDISSSAAAAAAPTGTDTLATATASATGTGTGMGAIGGVTTAPASGTGSGSSAGTGGSAAPAATSKAWGERSLVLPAGGAMAAVLGLAILL